MRTGNEDEHSLGAATIPCYDAVVAEVARINPSIVPVGPELVGDDPTQSALLRQFLNSSNHADGRAPPVVSFHLGSDSQDAFWSDWDGFLYGPQKCDEKTTECTGVVTEDESLKLRQAYDSIVELVDADTMKITTMVHDAFQPGPFKLMEVVSRRRKE